MLSAYFIFVLQHLKNLNKLDSYIDEQINEAEVNYHHDVDLYQKMLQFCQIYGLKYKWKQILKKYKTKTTENLKQINAEHQKLKAFLDNFTVNYYDKFNLFIEGFKAYKKLAQSCLNNSDIITLPINKQIINHDRIKKKSLQLADECFLRDELLAGNFAGADKILAYYEKLFIYFQKIPIELNETCFQFFLEVCEEARITTKRWYKPRKKLSPDKLLHYVFNKGMVYIHIANQTRPFSLWPNALFNHLVLKASKLSLLKNNQSKLAVDFYKKMN